MSFHFLIRFEPPPGKETEFRNELLRTVEPSRAEAAFAIHSEWVDEAEALLGQPVQGLRSREIGGGARAGAAQRR